MSLISFEDLANKVPRYGDALRALDGWIRAHASVDVINPATLAKELKSFNPLDLAGALGEAEHAGLLERRYKILTPSGVLADNEFEDPTKIPETLPDRFNRYFATADADVIPVFRRAPLR